MGNSDFTERTLKSTEVFHGRIIKLEKHIVELPDGRKSEREVVRHPGAVAVLAEPTPSQLLFVRQFRKAPEEVLWEIPAGKVDGKELPADCAARELREETGYRSSFFEPLFEFYTSPGFADEKIQLFYAHDVLPGEPQPDADEFVEVHSLSRAEISELLAAGQIRDAKTLIGVLWWLNKRGIEP